MQTNDNCTSAEVQLPCRSSCPRPFELFRGGILSASSSIGIQSQGAISSSLPYVLMLRNGEGSISFELAACAAAVTNLRHVRAEECIPAKNSGAIAEQIPEKRANKRKLAEKSSKGER